MPRIHEQRSLKVGLGVAGLLARSSKKLSGVAGLLRVRRLSVDIAGEKVAVDKASYSEQADCS